MNEELVYKALKYLVDRMELVSNTYKGPYTRKQVEEIQEGLGYELEKIEMRRKAGFID